MKFEPSPCRQKVHTLHQIAGQQTFAQQFQVFKYWKKYNIMVLDIDEFRPEKGGNPEKIKENQKRRFNDVGMVDKIVNADELWRKGMIQEEVLPWFCPLYLVDTILKHCNVWFYALWYSEIMYTYDVLDMGWLIRFNQVSYFSTTRCRSVEQTQELG